MRVVTERPYGVRASDGAVYWVQEFTLIYSLSHDIVMDEVKDRVRGRLRAYLVWRGRKRFLQPLLIGTRLNWREIALLRAYARYLRQVHFPTAWNTSPRPWPITCISPPA